MKTLILGARGMLGSDLGAVFSDYSPRSLDIDNLDVTDEAAVRDLFGKFKPEFVVNAAAYTDVDGCEANRNMAMRVNGKAPGYLAAAAKDIGAIFAHYSTDYVFDGANPGGYKEDDEPGAPLNFYGESKLAGEKNVRDVGGNYYLIRTSWLFGLNGKNFIETILKKVQDFGGQTPQRGSDPPFLRVVNDQHGKPTFALDLAKRTREIIEGGYAPGIYHVTNEPATTWHEFAKEIVNQSGLNSNQLRVAPCSSYEFPRPAKRPEYSILLNTKLPPMRSWKEALAEYLSERK